MITADASPVRHPAPVPAPGTFSPRGWVAVCLAALLASGCSGDLNQLGGSLLGTGEPTATAAAQGAPKDVAANSKSELRKAIEYWADEHKSKPHDLKIALNYARNLKAAGEKDQAFSVVQSMALTHGDNKELASEYGRLALDLGQVQVAQQVLTMADDPSRPDWRVISALGTVQAKQGKYADSIPFYTRALELSPNQASVLNNLAMAHAANGEPAKAEEILRRLLPEDRDGKIRQNLIIVLGLQNKHDEARPLAAQSDLEPKAISENAEYMRQMVKAPKLQAAAVAVPAQATAGVGDGKPLLKAAKTATPVTAAKATANPSQMRRGSEPGATDAPAGEWTTSLARAQ